MAEDKKIETNSVKAWLLAARPKTLSGAAVPVMIGVALAYVDAIEYGTDSFSWIAALLCLFFAFAMQIDANFINDSSILSMVLMMLRRALVLVEPVPRAGLSSSQ